MRIALFGHIILIPSQPVCAVSAKSCVFSGEATNTKFLFFGVTRSGLEACTITICDSLLSILLYIFVRINRQMKYML
jgi:hypothetical protein